MTIRPRPLRPPRAVVGCWAVSVAAGAGLVALGPHEPRPEPSALSPYSLAAYLRRIAGPDARQIRVNGVYGSGHHGAWQFVAALTWQTPDGSISGGTTELPTLAGAPTLDSTFDTDKLQAEQHIGWTLDQLDAVLDAYHHVDDTLALVEIEIPPDGHGQALLCHGNVDAPAQCMVRDRQGDTTRTFDEQLLDDPLRGPLAVQRASKPIGQ